MSIFGTGGFVYMCKGPVIFGATDTPVLDFWWHLLWVSKPEWEVYMIYIPWDSPLVWHLLPVYMASIAACHFPQVHVSAEVGCWIWTADLVCSEMH